MDITDIRSQISFGNVQLILYRISESCVKDVQNAGPPVSLHLELLLGEGPVPDDELGVGRLLAGLEAPLGQPHPRLQLVVEDAAVAHHEEEVLLVALRRLALHVPVVFPVE